MSSTSRCTRVRRPARGWRRASCGALALAAALAAVPAGAGDANCDGRVDGDDLPALIAVIFADPRSGCSSSDVNGDGRVGGADMVALLHDLGSPPPSGPAVTYFGLAAADGRVINPLGAVDGTPVYFRNSGSGFKVVVEGGSGRSGLPPGMVTFDADPADPLRRPDLQIGSDRALGDGSRDVCSGGVPAVTPPYFGPTQATADALNDLACNFALFTSAAFACTQDVFQNNDFVGAQTDLQFCLQVTTPLAFPPGETLVTVRLRDALGNLGPLRQLLLRVGTGPVPGTFTPTRTATPVTPQPTRTPTVTRTPTPTRTSAPAATPTRTRTPVTPPAATSTPQPGSPTPSPTATRSPSQTHTPSRTASPTQTPTHTRTPTPTATPTPAEPIGPVITFFGLTRSNDTLIASSGTTPDGWKIYTWGNRSGFSVVVEGKRGPSGEPVGRIAFNPVALPDLQIEVSQPLGNGSPAVCDRVGTPGGVPAVDPPDFEPTASNIAAINDLSCRFLDGNGVPGPRSRGDDPCVQFLPTGDFGFVEPDSTIQYCAFVNRDLEFPPGETVVTVRLRDQAGHVGAPVQVVIDIAP